MLYTILESNNYDEKANMTGIFLTKESAFSKMVDLLRDTLARSDIDWDIPDDAVGFEKEDDGCSVSVAEEAERQIAVLAGLQRRAVTRFGKTA